MVLVEQRRLEELEVAVGGAVEAFLGAVVRRVLEHRRVHPRRLRQRQQLILAPRRLQMLQHTPQRRRRRQPRLVHQHRQPPIHRQHQQPHRLRTLRHEVLDRRHHPIARPTLDHRVVQRRIQPPTTHQLRPTRPHPQPLIRLPMLLRDRRRVVIQIPPPIRPPHIMEHHHRQRLPSRPRRLRQQPALVVHRVPIVIPIHERHIHRTQTGQHVQTQIPMEHVPPPETRLVLRRIERRHRIDHMQHRIRRQMPQQQLGVLTPQRPDLHHPTRPHRIQDRRQHNIPERKHLPPPHRANNQPAPSGSRPYRTTISAGARRYDRPQ